MDLPVWVLAIKCGSLLEAESALTQLQTVLLPSAQRSFGKWGYSNIESTFNQVLYELYDARKSLPRFKSNDAVKAYVFQRLRWRLTDHWRRTPKPVSLDPQKLEAKAESQSARALTAEAPRPFINKDKLNQSTLVAAIMLMPVLDLTRNRALIDKVRDRLGQETFDSIAEFHKRASSSWEATLNRYCDELMSLRQRGSLRRIEEQERKIAHIRVFSILQPLSTNDIQKLLSLPSRNAAEKAISRYIKALPDITQGLENYILGIDDSEEFFL